jgi:transcriptional regulator with XRE-family HTH domain
MPYGDFYDISGRIRQIRGELKKGKFADLLGISRPNYYKYEDGRKPPAEVLQKIAEYGRVTVKWLLTGKEEEEKGPPDHPPAVSQPGRACEIQEFLFAEVLRAVEKFWGKYVPELEHRARVITALYNHCARKLEPPSYGLVEEIEIDLG